MPELLKCNAATKYNQTCNNNHLLKSLLQIRDGCCSYHWTTMTKVLTKAKMNAIRNTHQHILLQAYSHATGLSNYKNGGGIGVQQVFFRLSIQPQLQRYSPTKLCDGAKMAIFCVLYFQRAACSAFQTCILNSH